MAAVPPPPEDEVPDEPDDDEPDEADELPDVEPPDVEPPDEPFEPFAEAGLSAAAAFLYDSLR